jgi:hypothetical protein
MVLSQPPISSQCIPRDFTRNGSAALPRSRALIFSASRGLHSVILLLACVGVLRRDDALTIRSFGSDGSPRWWG